MEMKFARNFVAGVMEVLVFIFLVCIIMLIIDEKCSRNLDANDLTHEETISQVDFPPGTVRPLGGR